MHNLDNKLAFAFTGKILHDWTQFFQAGGPDRSSALPSLT
jgi:hypothetical protein